MKCPALVVALLGFAHHALTTRSPLAHHALTTRSPLAHHSLTTTTTTHCKSRSGDRKGDSASYCELMQCLTFSGFVKLRKG